MSDEAPAPIRCPSCEQLNRASRRFCAQCGVRFQPVCGACGTGNELGERFCGECGEPLEAVVTRVAAAAPSLGASLEAQAGALTAPSTPPNESPSSVSAGRYRLLRFLGEGAKKRVFLAHDGRLQREVAVALVRTEGLDAAGLTRVRREAEAMGRLGDHPNVVTVFDVEEEGDRVFIVSRFVDGGDLEARLRDTPDHRLPLPEALSIASDIARALDHAHGNGVVHRDVKPGNIWLSSEGGALLGDFGLASLSDLPRLTQEGTLLGTVAYMPPEQALGRPADARSDLYSLGATLYELVTGRPPFHGDDVVGVIAQHINSPPERPSWHEKAVPHELDDLILRLLAKAPDERPGSARLVVDALIGIAERVASRPPSLDDSREDERLPPPSLGLFVGRAREMAQLQEVFGRALAGEGSLAMLVGEPGVGKTRLSREFTVHAKLRGATVVMGPCYEGEGSVPYQPFVEALREYVRGCADDDRLRAELGAGASDLADLVPDIRSRLSDLPVSQPLEGEAQRQRLFESMTSFVSRVAQSTPLVIFLDDLHWADKPTLLLIVHLARRIRRDRVLLMGTYRDVELERTHPLADTIATLRTDGLYERILLRGLDIEGVRDLLRARSGHEVPARFAERILQETEGNPFFVEEVVKHLAETGVIRREDGQWVGDLSVIDRSIPEGVREVIGHRLTRLSAACNVMLTLGAAMTSGFSFELLTAVSDESEDTLLDLLDEALRAQVIRERSDEGRGQRGGLGGAVYEFSHALIRQTLYQELSTPRRVRLHRQIAEALEGLHGSGDGPHIAEIAFHYFQGAPGGDLDKAISTSMLAAEQARRSLAWEAAGAHTGRALEALEMKPDVDPALEFDLRFSLGEMQRLAGERAASHQTLARAAELARTLQEPELLARAILAYATEDATVQFDSDETRALLEEGLDAIGPQDNEIRVRLLSRLAISLLFSERHDRKEALANEAVEMARRIGDPGTLCRALIIHGICSFAPVDPETASARSREKLDLAERAGNSELVLNARFGYLYDMLNRGDGELFDREMETYHRLLEELRQPAMLWFAAVQRAMIALMRGPLDEAERLIEESREVGLRGEHPLTEIFYRAHRGGLETELRDAGPDAEALLTFWKTPFGQAVHSGATSGRTLVRLGRANEAREVFERTARQHFADIQPDGNWLGRMFLTAATCVDLGDIERARELYEILLPHAHQTAIAGPVALCHGSVRLILGQLAALLGRGEDAVAHFEAAIEKADRLRFGVLATRHRLEFSEMLAARDAPGDRERAVAVLTEALERAESLGMKSAVEAILALKFRLQGAESGNVSQSIYVVAEAVESTKPDFGAHAAPDGTVTLLFSDMEGFTVMTERLGDLRAREVIRRHNKVVREQLAAHGGYEVELQGDGFLLAFGSARQALLCAIEIQRTFARQAAGSSEDVPIRVRIGVHTGEALKDADKFFGRSVILTARIADQASGGEIMASNIVRELTQSTGDIRFGAERDAALKGISQTQRLVLVDWN